jgi:heme o synthase
VAASLLPGLLGLGGLAYSALAAALGAVFLVKANAVRRAQDTERRNRSAIKLFGFSIFYMFALFVALLATAA